jgi:Tol biopolymer transport system component
MRPLRFLALSLAAAVLAQMAIASPVRASFLGGNGRIAFETGRSDEFDIWSMKTGGSGKKRLTRSKAEDHSPAWDRGGGLIVFTRNAIGGGPGDLFRMAFDGSDVTRLTDTPHVSEVDPVWSPESEVPLSSHRILFSSSRTGHGDLYTIRASDGADLTRLTFSTKPDSSPTGASTRAGSRKAGSCS